MAEDEERPVKRARGSGRPDEDPGYEDERRAFMEGLHQFMRERGTPITKIPQLGHREIDLCMLYKQVIEEKLWKEISDYFNFPATCTNSSFTLRVTYITFLYYYEQVHFWGQKDPPPPPVLFANVRASCSQITGIFGAFAWTQGYPGSCYSSYRQQRYYKRETLGTVHFAMAIMYQPHDLSVQAAKEESSADDPAPPTPATPGPAARTPNPVRRAAPVFASPPAPLPPPPNPQSYQATGTVVSATHVRPRTGLEPLQVALESNLEWEQEWAIQLLLAISYHSDARLTQMGSLVAHLVRLLETNAAILNRSGYELDAPSAVSKEQSLARRVFVILRNLSLGQEGGADLGANAAFVSLVVELLDAADHELALTALDTLSNLAHRLTLADATRAMPHVVRALDSADLEEVLMGAEVLLQLTHAPQMEPDFLLREPHRAVVLPRLLDLLYEDQPEVLLIVLQILYHLSLSGGALFLTHNVLLIKRLVYFVSSAVQAAQVADDEVLKKAVLLLFNFSKVSANHVMLRAYEPELVAGAALLGNSPSASILLNLVGNISQV